MSLLQKALSFFTGKAPEEVPISEPQQEPLAEPTPIDTPPPDDVIYIYSHGFTNGVYRVAPEDDSFEKFLEYSNQLDRIKEQRDSNERAITNMELKLNTAALAFAADANTFVANEKLADNISLSLAEIGRAHV